VARVEIPAKVAAFLRSSIETYEELEALLLLSRTPEKWSTVALCKELRVSEAEVDAALEALVARGFVVKEADGSHSLFRADPELVDVLEQLAAVYAENPIDVVKAMSANAIQRVRNAALQAFADAFVWRKKNG
jgi:hypothetical protein